MRTISRYIMLGCVAVLSTLSFTARAATTPAISLTPTTQSVVAGTSITFTVTNESGNNVTAQTTFTTDDPRGSISGASYTAGQTGTWTVLATYQSLNAKATVSVATGSIAEIAVNPDANPQTVLAGATQTFTATPYDAASNPVTGQTATWSVVGTIGTITPNGVFTATTPGTGKVQAKIGDVVGEVEVTVLKSETVTNTNTTNSNTAATTAVKNTNAANTNNTTNTSSNQNTNTAATKTATTTTTNCTTLKPWAWILMLVLFLLIVAILYALVPAQKIWPVITALAGASILAYIQRTYGCGNQQWWAWVITLGTIALSAAAMQFRAKPNPTA